MYLEVPSLAQRNYSRKSDASRRAIKAESGSTEREREKLCEMSKVKACLAQAPSPFHLSPNRALRRGGLVLSSFNSPPSPRGHRDPEGGLYSSSHRHVEQNEQEIKGQKTERGEPQNGVLASPKGVWETGSDIGATCLYLLPGYSDSPDYPTWLSAPRVLSRHSPLLVVVHDEHTRGPKLPPSSTFTPIQRPPRRLVLPSRPSRAR
jgi:hypothetical protein